jgi:hypothetical protein
MVSTRDDFKQIYTVEYDNSQIILAINELSVEPLFDEICEELDRYDTLFTDECEKLALTVAEKLQSNVKDNIQLNGSIATGLMFHEVNIEQLSDFSYLTEEIAESNEETFYPAIIEEGRGEIVAKNGGVLAFYPTDGFGELVFAKKVKAVPPKPFWNPAVIQTDAEIDGLIEQVFESVA